MIEHRVGDANGTMEEGIWPSDQSATMPWKALGSMIGGGRAAAKGTTMARSRSELS
jgi:hypothetical protein